MDKHIKVCTKCKTAKELHEFVKQKSRKDGRATQCKECDKRQRRGLPYTADEILSEKKTETLKLCGRCGESKPLKDFHTESWRFGYINEICEECRLRTRAKGILKRQGFMEEHITDILIETKVIIIKTKRL